MWSVYFPHIFYYIYFLRIHVHKYFLNHQEKFGNDIDLFDGKKKIATKHMDDYGSDANTDDMANDSDLDVSTCMYTILL